MKLEEKKARWPSLNAKAEEIRKDISCKHQGAVLRRISSAMGVKNARRSLSRFVSECRMPYLDNDILRKKKKKKIRIGFKVWTVVIL